jgi:hypothetical protein
MEECEIVSCCFECLRPGGFCSAIFDNFIYFFIETHQHSIYRYSFNERQWEQIETYIPRYAHFSTRKACNYKNFIFLQGLTADNYVLQFNCKTHLFTGYQNRLPEVQFGYTQQNDITVIYNDHLIVFPKDVSQNMFVQFDLLNYKFEKVVTKNAVPKRLSEQTGVVFRDDLYIFSNKGECYRLSFKTLRWHKLEVYDTVSLACRAGVVEFKHSFFAVSSIVGNLLYEFDEREWVSHMVESKTRWDCVYSIHPVGCKLAIVTSDFGRENYQIHLVSFRTSGIRFCSSLFDVHFAFS